MPQTPAAPSSPSLCPVFSSGCPYSSAMQENSAFSSYLKQCKSFDNGCPFKDLDIVSQVKNVLAATAMTDEYQDHITLHQNLINIDWSNVKTVCSAFKDGCIFAKCLNQTQLSTGACPVWKNGCPFRIMMSNGNRSLVESLQSNSWDILIKGALTEDLELEEDLSIQEKQTLLASMLKEGTQKSHALAESVQFVKRFRKKEITWELYQLFLRDLYFVYITLEELFECLKKTSSNIAKVYFPNLLRTETLESDLLFFYGSNWKKEIMTSSQDYKDIGNMSPATANYVQRLRYCAMQPHAGELLIAHAYTRYLGDLSGGQLLKRMTRRSLDLVAAPRNATNAEIRTLPDEMVDGTRFYDFLDIEDLDGFKKNYRDQLDGLDITPEIADLMVEEANVAFRLNMEVFQELDAVAGFTAEEEGNTEETIPVAPASVSDHHNRDMSGIPPPECPFSAMLSGPTKSVPKPVTKEIVDTTPKCPISPTGIKIMRIFFLLSFLFAVLAIAYAIFI